MKNGQIFDTSCEVTKKQVSKNINSEPEMKELKRIFRNMTDEEKTRTGQYLEDQEQQQHPEGEYDKEAGMKGAARMLKDEDGSLVEIVYCRAVKCTHNMGRGKCDIVHSANGDDKISHNSEGVCENFFSK